MSKDTPIMPSGIHFAVTIFGGLFGMLSCWLIYKLLTNQFDWKLCVFMLSTIGIAADFLVGAFSQRYPFLVLLWLVPTNYNDSNDS